jgi:basic membrane lipoprotein Med (substrate-binding protein (PBP1-ABC) superfamily)
MDIKLNFEAKEIAEKLHEAIITTSFKEIFSTAVEQECKRLTEGNWSTDNIIRGAVKNYFEITIRQMLNEEYQEQIKGIIRKQITGERLDNLCEELVEKIKVEKY